MLLSTHWWTLLCVCNINFSKVGFFLVFNFRNNYLTNSQIYLVQIKLKKSSLYMPHSAPFSLPLSMDSLSKQLLSLKLYGVLRSAMKSHSIPTEDVNLRIIQCNQTGVWMLSALWSPNGLLSYQALLQGYTACIPVTVILLNNGPKCKDANSGNSHLLKETMKCFL